MMGLNAHVGDQEMRGKLLDFSITHCPVEEIVSTLQSKQLLLLQVCHVCLIIVGFYPLPLN